MSVESQTRDRQGDNTSETATYLGFAGVNRRAVPDPFRQQRRWTVLADGLIVLAAVAVYCNSFAGVFVLDDITSIIENPTIRYWWQLERVFRPPYAEGQTVAGRPLLNLSLAINYAISGTRIWSYHLANLLLHIANALLLFALLRRTFGMIRVRKPGGRKAEEGPCRADGGGPAGRGLGGCHCERSEDSGSKEPAITGQATRADNPACHTPHSTLHTSLAFAIAVLWTVHPLQVEAVTYIGDGLAACGKLDEAIAHYRKALQIAPDFAVAQYNLGNVLAARGRVDEAIVCYHKALKSEPEFWMVHNNLGNALFGRGQFEESIAYYQQALALKPDSVDVRRNLSFDLSERVKLLRTLAERREAMRLRPNDAALLNHVAWMLATNPNASVRNGGEAVELAQRAVKVSGGQEAVLLDTLAAAYAEGGRFAEAVQTAERALALATIRANAALAQKISERLRLYRAGLPFRDSR